jgi:tripeptidyl-peptidase I
MALTHLLVALVAVATGVAAAPRPTPAGWSIHRRADPDTLIPLRFSLAQSNLDKLGSHLLDIADPVSPNYGKHWSPAKVSETFRPSKETIESVHSWLVHDGGIHAEKIRLSPNGDIIHLDVTIAEAENLLQAEYYVYNANEDGALRFGCHDGYTLPEHISQHVDFIWPTVHFGGPRSVSRRDGSVSPTTYFGREAGAPKKAITNVSLPIYLLLNFYSNCTLAQPLALATEGCDKAVTLDCLRELYNFDFTPVSGNVNTVGVGK